MNDQYIYRNELLKKYILLALVTSLFLSPIYYHIDEIIIAVTLNIFSLATIYLKYSSSKNSKFVINSRLFMIIVFILFFISFINSNQVINSSIFLLLYPIASFSIRGPKEGTLWALTMSIVFTITYIYYPSIYNFYSFIFFLVTYFMISYLLYYYRFYEFLNFEEINKNLELKIKQRTRQLYEKNEELQKISTTDNLTGLNNRMKLDEVLKSETNRTQRYNHTFGIIILDIDDFKSVNDTFGHQVGDYVLKTIANIIKENIRKTDIVGRWGGEEFMVICPESSKDETISVAEKIKEQIASYNYDTVGKKTASFGVSLYHKDMDISNTILKADKALYDSKNSGKNRISFAF